MGYLCFQARQQPSAKGLCCILPCCPPSTAVEQGPHFSTLRAQQQCTPILATMDSSQSNLASRRGLQDHYSAPASIPSRGRWGTKKHCSAQHHGIMAPRHRQHTFSESTRPTNHDQIWDERAFPRRRRNVATAVTLMLTTTVLRPLVLAWRKASTSRLEKDGRESSLTSRCQHHDVCWYQCRALDRSSDFTALQTW